MPRSEHISSVQLLSESRIIRINGLHGFWGLANEHTNTLTHEHSAQLLSESRIIRINGLHGFWDFIYWCIIWFHSWLSPPFVKGRKQIVLRNEILQKNMQHQLACSRASAKTTLTLANSLSVSRIKYLVSRLLRLSHLATLREPASPPSLSISYRR